MIANAAPIGLYDDPDDPRKLIRPPIAPTVQDAKPETTAEMSAPVKSPTPIATSSPVAPSGPPPVQPAPIGNPKLKADQDELQRLQDTGSGLDQYSKKPGLGHKILSTLGRIGDVAGSAMFPFQMAMIPGTTLHHDELVNQRRGRIAQDLDTEEQQAKINQMEHPEPKPKEEHWSVSPDHVGPNGEPVEIEQNSGQMRVVGGDELAGVKLKTSPDKPINDPKAGYAQAIAEAIKAGRDPSTDPHVTAWKSALDSIAKQEKPDSPEQQYIDEYQKKNPGAGIAEAVKAYAGATQKPPVVNLNQSTARSDKSYTYHNNKIDDLAKPVGDAVARLGRLQETLRQATPQADSLAAPELLTVMAGGQGSGLRMNEAEIARVIGGRSNFESMKAALNKWQMDPSKALSITPDQRKQMQALVNAVASKLHGKQSAFDEARDSLLNTDDPKEHRRILADLHKKLTQIDDGGESKSGSASEPTRPSSVPAGYVFNANGPKGAGWYKPKGNNANQ